jgi:hypothetical protein
MLHEGGTIVGRELVAARAQKQFNTMINVPRSVEPAIVAEQVATDQKTYQLYVPKASNFASIDAWMPGFGAFQMTVAEKHDIKDGVADDIAKLGDSGFQLFWVLPPQYLDSFTKEKATQI